MLVRRNPFARQELHRAREYVAAGTTCAWCGNVKQTLKGASFLHKYRTETDGGRVFLAPKLFCSNDCYWSFCPEAQNVWG